ncbi:MAG: T9SS type A sorting domain-containing protein, partial [Bacteroidetes bacterium]|nr:T9SS type A sorting domain-containing protein [Bacteroidota bacterium]
KTAEEAGTRLFSIERSSNVKDFVTIGQVAAKDVAGLNGYKYVDESVAAGVWYYRLRMQDIDGKYTYSNVISVNVGAAFQGMLLYPNPVQDRLFVQMQSGQVEKTVVRLVDIQGKTLQQQEITLSSGVTSLTFDTRTLARGTYFVVVAGSRPQIRQFIKP